MKNVLYKSMTNKTKTKRSICNKVVLVKLFMQFSSNPDLKIFLFLRLRRNFKSLRHFTISSPLSSAWIEHLPSIFDKDIKEASRGSRVQILQGALHTHEYFISNYLCNSYSLINFTYRSFDFIFKQKKFKQDSYHNCGFCGRCLDWRSLFASDSGSSRKAFLFFNFIVKQ